MSVVIVTAGYVTNIRYLLESGPDEHSPLSGTELVRRKARNWVIAGGRYPGATNPTPVGNFKPDPESAGVAAQHWPRPVAFSGIGRQIMTGVSLAQTPPDSPVRRVYELYLTASPDGSAGPPVGAAVCCCGPKPFWRETAQGHDRVFDNDTNPWRPLPDADQQVRTSR
jgi:hypothetical protein